MFFVQYLPNIIIGGFTNKAVDEAKERIRGAFADSHIMLPRKRITINLAPADIPKADSGFDLAIAVAVLLASEQIPNNLGKGHAFIGELGLSGELRAVRGIIGKLLIGRTKGINSFFIPSLNLRQAQLVPNITLYSADNLKQLYDYFNNNNAQLKPIDTSNSSYFIIYRLSNSVLFRLTSDTTPVRMS
jgi:magnesium chelatase family protein